MFKVKYYQHTRKFFEELQIQSDELHLTQSAALSYFLKENHTSANILGYKTFIENLFPSWYHPHTEVYLHSIIRKYIRDNTPEGHHVYFERNIKDFYLSILFLIECGIPNLYTFSDLKLADDQLLLIEMVKNLSKDPVVIKYLSDRATMNIEIVNTKLGIEKINKIYIHHFDYIDGLRMMIFHLLRQIGFEVIFCIPYQKDLPGVYKTWKEIYENIVGTPSENWEPVQNDNIDRGLKFAKYLDKSVVNQKDELQNISFMTFDHPTRFKEYLDSTPIQSNHHEVITVFEENLNLYTDQTVKHHFYATTYGKFFLGLQNCKKVDDGIVFSYDDFVNMITSGWVQSGNVNGAQSLSLLIDLRDYMQGVSTFPAMIERLQALVELQEFGNVFDEFGKEQAGRNRLKQYLGNPFRSFPFLHQSRYSITVKQLIECTKDLARKLNRLLLNEQEERNVQNYLVELNRIFMTVKEGWNPEVSEKFEKLFKINIPNTWSFGKEELFQLLSFYLGSSQDDDYNKILNFDQLVGKTLSTETIHVTGLSLKTFPWKSPTLPRLLNHSWLKKCIYKSFITNNREIRLNALVVDYYSRKLTRNTALYSIYHLLAFSKGDIIFSFIKNLNENDGPSIYLTILEELYKTDSGQSEVVEVTLSWEEPVTIDDELPLELFEQIPDLLWLDSDFCHKKFFLNAVIEHHPIYEKDFHQQQVFAAVGKLLVEQGDGAKDLRETVFPLFPQWTNAQKQNLIDTAYSSGLRKYKSYENVYYPRGMKRLQRLYSKYEVTWNWKAKHQYDHDSFKVMDHISKLKLHMDEKKIIARNGHHCRMCPFLHVCVEGEYFIDASDY
jgi:hypothetical protein